MPANNSNSLNVLDIASRIENISHALYGASNLDSSSEMVKELVNLLSSESDKLNLAVQSGIIKGLPLMPNTSNYKS